MEVSNDFLENLQADCFVPVFSENYNRVPVTGKVMLVGDSHFKVHFWKGSYDGKWTLQFTSHENDGYISLKIYQRHSLFPMAFNSLMTHIKQI